MEKEHQPESLSEVAIKADYAPSDIYSSEPPPAYKMPKSSAVQVAKIIAYTVVAVSFILGGFILASAYVSSNAQCKQLEQELQFLSDTFDRSQPLQPEALIQDEPKTEEKEAEKPVEEVKPLKEAVEPEETQESASNESEESEENDLRVGLKLKFPMQMILNEIAQVLAEKQERQDTNCVIEKRVAEQVFDRSNPFMRMTFGMPQQEHVTGEKIIIICKTGNDQRRPEAEETMPHPVLIPLPPQQFQTHMPQQMPPQFHIQAHMRPVENIFPPMQPEPEQEEPQQRQPNPLIAHIIQKIIAQRLQMEAMRSQQQEQEQQQQQQIDQNQLSYQNGPSNSEMLRQSKLPIPEEILQQVDRLPHSSGVIIAVSEPEEKPQQEMAQEIETNVQPKLMPMHFSMVHQIQASPMQEEMQYMQPQQQQQEQQQPTAEKVEN